VSELWCPYLGVVKGLNGSFRNCENGRTLVALLPLEAVVATSAFFIESCDLRSTTALKESERGAEKLLIIGRATEGTGLGI
jgi:hypothetical protein